MSATGVGSKTKSVLKRGPTPDPVNVAARACVDGAVSGSLLPRQTVQLDMLPSAESPEPAAATAPPCIVDAVAEMLETGATTVEPTAGDPRPAPPDPPELDGSQVAGRLVELPLTSLLSGKNRRDEDGDVSDLKYSLQRAPQLQNIVVRPAPGVEGKYEIIGGHRRVEALLQLGRTHVEAKVFETDDVTAELYGLEENLRRKALSDEGAALARAKELYEARGATGRGGDRRSAEFVSNGHGGRKSKSATAQLAALTGKSERQVRREIRVAEKGDPELKAALVDGNVTKNEAEKIAGHPPVLQRQKVAEKRAKKNAGEGTKQGSDALGDFERSLSDARRQLAAFREKSHSTAVAPDVVGRLKEMVAALASELADLEKVQGKATTADDDAGRLP